MTAGRDRGQATVELALVLPFLALLLLLVVQVGLVVRAQILVTNAAREAARAAAVDPDPAAAGRAASASTTLDPRRLAVHVRERGGPGASVRVEVRYDAPTELALVGALLPDVELVATATMRVEVAAARGAAAA
ncbi:MAG: TadE/TadG family type IV pilus assembly protein [Acidimicrobiales bacterium]